MQYKIERVASCNVHNKNINVPSTCFCLLNKCVKAEV